jgi:integrase
MKLIRFYKKHGAYYFVDLQNKWHHLGRDYAEALRLYTTLIGEKTIITMDQLFDRFVKEIVPEKADKTRKNYSMMLIQLRKAFGPLNPKEITAVHIYAYMDKREAKVRANREKTLLSQVFSYAIRWGYITTNPCHDVKGFKERPRTRYVTDEEFWAIYDEAPATIQKAMLLSLATGLRLSDVLSLKKSHCKPEGLVVVPRKTKNSTGKKLIFTWTETLRNVIVFPADAPDNTPFILTKFNAPYTPSGFNGEWRKVMKRVFPKPEDQFTFHDLRAKAASDNADGKLLGHSDPRTLNRHYRRKPELHIPNTIER